ncbi:hypothetical protein Tco_0795376 [Tanacetum coccineum]
MQELSEQFQELQDEVLELLRKEKLYAKFTKSEVVRNWEVPTTPSESSVKDKILATLSETSKVENVPAKMLRDLNQQMENRADDGKANIVTDVLSRKERVKPRRVRAIAMTIQYGLRGMILAAQRIYIDEIIALEDIMRACVIDFGGSYHSSIQYAPFEALYGRKLLIKEKFKAVRDRQKSYADNGRKPLEFKLGDRVLLKVSPWKGVVDKTLCFVEEPVEIMDREIESLKRSKISLVKVRWNSKHGPEFTWERKDYMKYKYPQLFLDRADESASLNLGTRFPKGGDNCRSNYSSDLSRLDLSISRYG